MPILRILSWNIRTFGVPRPTDVAIRGLVEIMCESRADIICVQEVQCGTGIAPWIGVQVAPEINEAVNRLFEALSSADPGADWQGQLSPVNNSGEAKSMRDAYAYFWKATPAGGRFSHSAPLAGIAMLAEPEILRQPGLDFFPGRRPGMMTFDLTTTPSSKPTSVNVVSWHAPVPCNEIKKQGASSGRGIIELATLTEIGGIAPRSSDGGRTYQDQEINPLPNVDTIVLGDFNYSFGKPKADRVYRNLTKNYEPCVNTPDDFNPTTYSSNPTIPFSGKSSYDNIFVLRSHGHFTACLTNAGNSSIDDFIAKAAIALGAASEVQYFANEAAWYVVYTDLHKGQYSQVGLSDHMPACADFTVTSGVTSTDRVLATSGEDNNCLFHAIFGVPFDGVYYDNIAAVRRSNLAAWVRQLTAQTTGAVRADILSAMLVCFDDDPNAALLLRVLLTNLHLDPFMADGFAALLKSYAQSIESGRMLLWHEAVLIAHQAEINIDLYSIVNGTYQSTPIVAGQGMPISIYHFGLHFFRFRGN